MAKKCNPCMSDAMKDSVIAIVEEEGGDTAAASKALENIPNCKDDSPLGCSTGKKTRKASPYNNFIGICMNDPQIKELPFPERMKACAARWKQQRGEV